MDLRAQDSEPAQPHQFIARFPSILVETSWNGPLADYCIHKPCKKRLLARTTKFLRSWQVKQFLCCLISKIPREVKYIFIIFPPPFFV